MVAKETAETAENGRLRAVSLLGAINGLVGLDPSKDGREEASSLCVCGLAVLDEPPLMEPPSLLTIGLCPLVMSLFLSLGAMTPDLSLRGVMVIERGYGH